MMVGAVTLISDEIEMNGLCAKRLLSRKRLWSRNDFFCETTFAEKGMAFLCCALGRALFCATGHASVFVFCARVRPSARVRPKGFDARMDAARQFVTLALLCFLR